MPPFIFTILYILTSGENPHSSKTHNAIEYGVKGSSLIYLSNSYPVALYNNNGRTDYEN